MSQFYDDEEDDDSEMDIEEMDEDASEDDFSDDDFWEDDEGTARALMRQLLEQVHPWKPSDWEVHSLVGTPRGQLSLMSEYRLERTIAELSTLKNGGLMGVIGLEGKLDKLSLRNWLLGACETVLGKAPTFQMYETDRDGPMVVAVIPAIPGAVAPLGGEYEMLSDVPTSSFSTKFTKNPEVVRAIQGRVMGYTGTDAMLVTGLARYHEGDEEHYPTVAGWVAFAPDAGFLPALEMRVADKSVQARGNLQHWLKDVIAHCGNKIPAKALMELLINAIGHRDWDPEAHRAVVRIELEPTCLTIINPGRLSTRFNNPLLMRLLRLQGLARGEKGGLKRVQEELRSLGMRLEGPVVRYGEVHTKVSWPPVRPVVAPVPGAVSVPAVAAPEPVPAPVVVAAPAPAPVVAPAHQPVAKAAVPSKPTLPTTGDQLRRWREGLKLTQRQAAERLDVTQGALSQNEAKGAGLLGEKILAALRRVI